MARRGPRPTRIEPRPELYRCPRCAGLAVRREGHQGCTRQPWTVTGLVFDAPLSEESCS